MTSVRKLIDIDEIDDTLALIRRHGGILFKTSIVSAHYTKKAYRLLCETGLSLNCHVISYVDPAELDDALCMLALREGCPIEYIPRCALTANLCVTNAVKSDREFCNTYRTITDRRRPVVDSLLDIHIELANVRPFLWAVCALDDWLLNKALPPLKARLAVVKKNGLALRYFAPGMKFHGLSQAAIKQNPLAIADVAYPDHNMCLDCYRRNKNTFPLINDNGRRHVAYVTLSESMMALHALGLSPNLLSEICISLLGTDRFPRIHVDAPSSDEQDAQKIIHGINGWKYWERSLDVVQWDLPLHEIWSLVRCIRGQR